MLISASSEFVALCREQVALLTQGLGASLSVVYLAEEFVEEGTSQTKLIPVVVYPETAMVWQRSNALALPLPQEQDSNTFKRQLRGASPQLESTEFIQAADSSQTDEEQAAANNESLLPNAQIVLPLIYEDVMMGFLVTAREDRPWNEQEENEIERIAQTLAIACILDRRREWYEQQLHQQQHLQDTQRDLLDDLLHQFRNPLTAVRTFGKLLIKRLRPGDANREVAVSIVRESDRLQELLQQFDRAIDLKVEDLEPAALPPNQVLMEATVQTPPKPVPLLPDAGEKGELCWVADVLEPLLMSAVAIALERNLQIHTEIPPELPAVRANAKALREALTNIIDNALKYTPDGGEIFVQAGREKDGFQGTAISDTGPGIPARDLEHLFERFYRGVQAQTEIPGTGLGLAIAKQLVEQMQGEIEVFSPAIKSVKNSPNAPGTTFIVWLPEVKS